MIGEKIDPKSIYLHVGDTKTLFLINPNKKKLIKKRIEIKIFANEFYL